MATPDVIVIDTDEDIPFPTVNPRTNRRNSTGKLPGNPSLQRSARVNGLVTYREEVIARRNQHQVTALQ